MSTRNRAIVGYGSQANVGSGASNGARSGRRRRANEDDDEEGGEQESGRRRGAASSADIGMSVSELEALISTTTRFVVSHQGKTVQRAEILKFLTEDHSVSKNAFAEIIKGVEKRLEETMGFKMVEVANNSFMLYNPYTLAEINMDFTCGDEEEDEQEEEEGNLTFRANSAARRRRRRMANGGGSGRGRGRSSRDPDDDEEEEEGDDEEEEEDDDLSPEELLDHTRKGLLLIVLANLYMNEDPMSQTELLECLKMANIDPEAKVNDGDIDEKLTVEKIVLEELRIANYLKRTKVTNGGNGVENLPNYYIFSWGLRAWLEFSPTDVVAFVKNVYKTVGGHNGSEEELRWERMSKRLAKDEQARKMLLQRGQAAFEELVGQKRHDLDGNADGQQQQSRESPPATNRRHRGRPRGAATQNGRRREEEEGEEEEEEEDEGEIPDSYRESARRSLRAGGSSRQAPPARGRGRRGAGRSTSPEVEEEEEEEEPVDVKPKRGRGRPKKK